MRKLLVLAVTPLIGIAAIAALTTPAHADATGKLTALNSTNLYPPGADTPVEEVVNPAAGCYRLDGGTQGPPLVSFENGTDQNLPVYGSTDCTEDPIDTADSGTTYQGFGSISVKVT
ncbi:hypothetical protein [Streptomyces sp. NPDC051567]|uniref:hypothetical protein n=1 Tax=Streptomyces sp. NPDC051567 TaxID=3365660 RepID=UPI00379A38ED